MQLVSVSNLKEKYWKPFRVFCIQARRALFQEQQSYIHSIIQSAKACNCKNNDYFALRPHGETTPTTRHTRGMLKGTRTDPRYSQACMHTPNSHPNQRSRLEGEKFCKQTAPKMRSLLISSSWKRWITIITTANFCGNFTKKRVNSAEIDELTLWPHDEVLKLVYW